MSSKKEEHHPGSINGRCHHCSAKMVKYTHILNKQMISSLVLLAKAGGRANLRDLGLGRVKFQNFQKMRYFGLVRYGYHEDGTRAGGVWEVTDRGYRFLAGEIKIRKRVKSYRGKFSESVKGECVSMRTLKFARWRHQKDYARDAEPI